MDLVASAHASRGSHHPGTCTEAEDQSKERGSKPIEQRQVRIGRCHFRRSSCSQSYRGWPNFCRFRVLRM